MQKLTDQQKAWLKSVADHFDQEDRFVRERMLLTWKELKLYWNNFTNIYYSEVAHDWRIYNPGDDETQYSDMAYYDKPINIFRAYLESIIAALSVTVPTVICYPDDATNPDDLDTAKAGDKICKLIYRHNKVQLLWIHALYIFCTEGLVAAYNYEDSKEEYGTYDEKKEETVTEMKFICPQCQMEIMQELFNQVPQSQVMDSAEQIELIEDDEFDPDSEDAPLHAAYEEDYVVCPHCAAQLDPNLQATPFVTTRLVGVTKHPKSRQCVEVYGGLNVKVPSYARRQKDVPYVRFSEELNYTQIIEMWPHLIEVAECGPERLTGIDDPYESWARLNPLYNGEYPINVSTVNRYWFRPCAFNVLPEEGANELKKLFPDGCKYIKVNEYFAEACNESLDDHWTLTHNPLADYLVHQPIGMLLVSIQDITNELVSLILQTIEHGIPQGFADPSVLNFDEYRKTEVAPGMVFPATARTGRSLQEFFHEIKSATLSQEVIPFGEMIQQMGQLVSGALPSLFGGQMEGSKTASEYSMSRSQALQRLQTPWKMLTMWWENVFGKVIPQFIKTVVDDEKSVERDPQGQFINIIIKKSELSGKLGKVEVEGTENLPMTWMQEKDVVMQLLQANNPIFMQALMAPENLPYLKRAIGLTDFKIPGEDDRQAQFEEIRRLLQSQPLEVPPPPEMLMQNMAMGMPVQPIQEPSVPINPDVDNNQIHSEICRSWLISDEGRYTKETNPAGYQNVLLHKQAHDMVIQQQMMQQAMMGAPPPGEEEGKPQNASGAAPKKQEDTDGNRATVN